MVVSTMGSRSTIPTDRCQTCGGNLILEDGEAKCMMCDRTPTTFSKAEVKDPRPGLEVEKEVVRVKRKYTKQIKPGRDDDQNPIRGSEKSDEVVGKYPPSHCIGCKVIEELQRCRALYEGYRLAISDMGGNDARAR